MSNSGYGCPIMFSYQWRNEFIGTCNIQSCEVDCEVLQGS